MAIRQTGGGGMTHPRIGLALGGGGARGMAHIPVIEVLDEFGVRPTIIAGTSIGALIGAGYANGMTGKEMRATVLEMFADRSAVLARVWDLRPKTIGDLMSGMTGFSLQLSAERIAETFLPKELPVKIEDLPLTFVAIAADYFAWHDAPLASGPLRRAVAASIAIPFLFKPVVVDGRVMIDGGVVNPLPVEHVRNQADIVIAVDVIGGPRGNPAAVPKPGDVAFGAAQITMQTITREKLRHSPPDILLSPNINVFRVLDFFKVRAILKASEPIKDELRRALDEKLSSLAAIGEA